MPGPRVAVRVSQKSAARLTGRLRQVDSADVVPEDTEVGLVGVTSLLADRLAQRLTEAGMGAVLDSGIAVQPQACENLARSIGLDPVRLPAAYNESMAWTNRLTGAAA